MTTHENMAKAICKYWSKYFINTANHTNGDSNCDLIGMVYDTLAMKENQSTDNKKIEAFKEALYNILMNSKPWIIDCDYGPCSELIKACKNAELPTSVFPWKTVMRIEWVDGVILIKEGHGSDFKKLLTNEV